MLKWKELEESRLHKNIVFQLLSVKGENWASSLFTCIIWTITITVRSSISLLQCEIVATVRNHHPYRSIQAMKNVTWILNVISFLLYRAVCVCSMYLYQSKKVDKIICKQHMITNNTKSINFHLWMGQRILCHLLGIRLENYLFALTPCNCCGLQIHCSSC